MAENERSRSDDADVVLMVCIKCGREEQFEGDETPPPDMTCEKCGSQVFRRFDSDNPGEASQDFRDTTDRDTNTDDPPDDATSQDLLDLNNP